MSFSALDIAQTADPIAGTWELNLAKSKFIPGPAPKSETRIYEVNGDKIKLTIKGIDAAGKPTAVQSSYVYDGKDYPITGSPDADMLALRRVDTDTVTGEVKRAGKVAQTVRRVVSKDGKVLTITFKGTNAKGQAVDDFTVYDRR